MRQCEPIQKVINATVDFLSIEMQQVIIEGNHVVPWGGYSSISCNIIELYLYVDDREQLLRRTGRPTHNRSLNVSELNTVVLLQNHIITEAKIRDKPIFETSDGLDEAIEFVGSCLADIVPGLTH